jgi:CHAT domain-containing protein
MLMNSAGGFRGRIVLAGIAALAALLLLLPATPLSAQDLAATTDEDLAAQADALYKDKAWAEAAPLFAELVTRFERSGTLTGKDLIAWAEDLRTIYRNLERDEAVIDLDRRMIASCRREQGAGSACKQFWHGALAADLLTARRLDEARAAFTEWQTTAEAALGIASPEARKARWEFSFFLKNEGRLDEAVALRERSLAIEEEAYGTMADDTVEHAGRLYEFYNAAGRYAEAEALARRFAKAHRASIGFDEFDTQLWQFRAAIAMQSRGDPQGALRELEAMIAEAGGKPMKYPIDTEILRLYEQLGRYDDAERMLLAKSAVVEADPNATALESEWSTLAEFYGYRNRLTEAETYYRKVIALNEAEGEDMMTAAYRYGLADIYIRQGRLKDAQAEYQKYYDEFAPDGSFSTFAPAAVAGLARVYRLQGDAARAEKLLLDVLALGEEGVAITELASLYVEQGRYAEAEPLLDQLVANNFPIGGYFVKTNYYEVLGDLYLAQGKAIEALDIYTALRGEFGGGDGPVTTLMVPLLTKIAEANRQVGFPAQSNSEVDRAIAAFGPEPDLRDPAVLQLLTIRARNLVTLQQIDDGLALYRRLREAATSVLGADHPTTITLTEELSQAAFWGDRAEEGLAAARALVVALEQRSRSAGTDSISEAQLRREAAKSTGSYLFAADMLVRESGRADLRALGFTAVQRAMETPASEAVVRAAVRRYAESEASGLADLIVEREALQKTVSANAVQFSDLLLQRGEEILQRRVQLAREKQAAQARIAAIDAAIAKNFPDYFDLVRPASLDIAGAQALLRNDEAVLMIVPVPGGRGTHVFTITSDAIEWRRSQWSERRISAAVRRLLWFAGANVTVDDDEAIAWEGEVGSSSPLAFDRPTAHALYSELVAPSMAMLEGKRHLFVAASGGLSTLPFAMLVASPPEGRNDDPEALRQTDWLGDRFAMIQLPTLQSLAMLRRNPGERPAGRSGFVGYGDHVLGRSAERRGVDRRSAPALAEATDIYSANTDAGVLVDPDRLRRLSSLPGTGIELRAMAKALDAGGDALRLGPEATETAFKQARLDKVAIIAIATHGLMAGDIAGAIEPGLVFTPPASGTPLDDGYLTASEVAELRLDADWVILSACNTASGDGSKGATGLSGLARAFFYAGADNLLASHWPVRDDVASLLTVRTVEIERAEPSLSRAEAFSKAMREIRMNAAHDRASDSWAHPNAWAPFTLVGDSAQ